MSRKKEPGTGIKKKTNSFLSGYKTYDVAKEGYGSVNQWRSLFDAVMTGEEAAVIIGKTTRSPLDILGFATLPTKDALKSRYRQLVKGMQGAFGTNPTEDETNDARALIAAYTILLAQVERT
jgi:hypothetical protein